MRLIMEKGDDDIEIDICGKTFLIREDRGDFVISEFVDGCEEEIYKSYKEKRVIRE